MGVVGDSVDRYTAERVERATSDLIDWGWWSSPLVLVEFDPILQEYIVETDTHIHRGLIIEVPVVSWISRIAVDAAATYIHNNVNE